MVWGWVGNDVDRVEDWGRFEAWWGRFREASMKTERKSLLRNLK
jgi:hypothetical protein